MTPRLLLLATALLVPVAAFAENEPDEEGCKDHPQIPRFPGFIISSCTTNDFAANEFQVGDDKYEKKEGRFWDIGYQLKEGAKQPSSLEIARNYENAVKKLGGKKLFQAVDSGGGVASYKMPLGKSERWFQIDMANSSTALSFKIVELKEMDQKVELSASEMLDALNKDGFLALYGILFDTGKDTIKPESEPLLGEIVTLLKDNAALRLSVEGHTDNVGQAKANQALSQKRAEAVKKYLAGKGVDGKRLETKGWGDTKPVADNRTDDGKAKNRRVELVKK